MNKQELLSKRAEILAQAEAMKSADGSFKDDATRTAFDAKLAEVEGIDAQVRALPTEPTVNLAEAEQARVLGIQSAVRTAKLAENFATDMVKRGLTIDQARGEIFAKLEAEQRSTETNRPNITFGEDTRDKWLRGAANWLLVRTGMAGLVARAEGVDVRTVDPGEFRGLSLIDLAKETLERAGVAVRGMDRMTLAGQAMAHRSANYQTQSDFATLLENTMHKVLRASYGVTPDTWSKFCGIGTASDFRVQNWYRTGALTVLEDMNEHGEFKSKNIPDSEKATYSVGTKGNVIGITRQVIVNDDMGFVMRLTEMLGRAGKLTIEKAVYAKLLENGGLGPTQSNSQPLFHSSRSNINTTAAAITVASVELDANVMASQLDPNGQDFLDLQPAVLLVPRAKRGDALTINAAEFDPADSKFQKPNTVRGMFRDVVATPRLTGTRRYLFADPSTAPVFMVSFLEGQREPVLESQDGWRFDGVEMKARLDFGVDVVDYRGAVTNAGA